MISVWVSPEASRLDEITMQFARGTGCFLGHTPPFTTKPDDRRDRPLAARQTRVLAEGDFPDRSSAVTTSSSFSLTRGQRDIPAMAHGAANLTRKLIRGGGAG